jgi:hypothetical protein
MKCLFKLNCGGNPEECEKEAKDALLKNLKSAFCWNMCGIIAKTNKKPAVAASSFMNCLKFDPANQRVLREATDLYLFARDYEKHLEFRKKLLIENTGQLANWNGVILGHLFVLLI